MANKADDFRLSVGFFEHPKTVRLQSKLGDTGVLCLIKLFRFVTLSKPTGELTGMDSEDIEAAAGWPIDREGEFIKVLIGRADNANHTRKGQFLDLSPQGHYVVHDWAEWNPWAAGAPIRSEIARKGGLAKAEAQKAKLKADSRSKSCSQQKSAMLLSYPILSEEYTPQQLRENDTQNPVPTFVQDPKMGEPYDNKIPIADLDESTWKAIRNANKKSSTG